MPNVSRRPRIVRAAETLLRRGRSETRLSFPLLDMPRSEPARKEITTHPAPSPVQTHFRIISWIGKCLFPLHSNRRGKIRRALYIQMPQPGIAVHQIEGFFRP